MLENILRDAGFLGSYRGLNHLMSQMKTMTEADWDLSPQGLLTCKNVFYENKQKVK